MTNRIARKEKIITVVGANYISYGVVLDLLSKAFEPYCKSPFTRKQFQVSIWENTHATAGVILTVLGIEAYRNRIAYLDKRKIGKNVASDLSTIFKKKASIFPTGKFEEIIKEVMIMRDSIAHNHIYKVEVHYSQDWTMLGHKQKLLDGYGDSKRFSGSVVEKTRKTKVLRFNVQPAKIGFEDLFTLLAIFDLFVGISQKVLGNAYLPFNLSYELNGHWEDNLSKVLAYYFELIPNPKFKKQFNSILKSLKADFSSFIDSLNTWVITNICPRCYTFGIDKPNNVVKCCKCTFGVQVIH